MKRNKHKIGPTNGTATPATETLPAVDAVEVAELPLPQVPTMPPAIARLSWLDRLILADDFLTNPRRFLAQCTHTAADAADPQTQPRADKTIPYSELRTVLEAFLPDARSGVVDNRRIQRMFTLSKLGELPSDELETSVCHLINQLQPFGAGDRPGLDAWGDEDWTARKKRHQEHAAEVIAQIDEDIVSRLVEGERDERLIVTSDLPTAKLISLHSESDLYWDLALPIQLVGVHYDDLPGASPLRKLDHQRLPRTSRAGGPPVVLLGPASPATITALPRRWYYLATAEAFCRHGWKTWSGRHRNFLDNNRETQQDFERFQAFEELGRKPLPTLWPYPDAPNLPALDGFANRALFAVDGVGHLGKYLTRPPVSTPLATLLAGRRVLVDSTGDEAAGYEYSAKAYTGKWYASHRRDDLAEALWSLARTTLAAIEQLEAEWRDHAIGEFQKMRK